MIFGVERAPSFWASPLPLTLSYVPLVDGFEGVTDLLRKSALKKGFSERCWTPFAPGFGTGLLGTEGLYCLLLYIPRVVIFLLKLSICSNFWQCYVYDHGVKITFSRLNIFYINEAIAVILFALIYRLGGLSESTFTFRTLDLLGPNDLASK